MVGGLVACSTAKDEIKLQDCWFKDFNVNNFISTCSTSVPENLKITCHHDLVNHPQMAESYLKYAAFIDIHNHYRTGTWGVEVTWHTKKGLWFTNSFLPYKYFCNKSIEYLQFKMAAAQALMYHNSTSLCKRRGSLNISLEAPVHNLVKLLNSRKCHYCCHNYGNRRSPNLSTMFKCGFCNLPVCKPRKSDC